MRLFEARQNWSLCQSREKKWAIFFALVFVKLLCHSTLFLSTVIRVQLIFPNTKMRIESEREREKKKKKTNKNLVHKPHHKRFVWRDYARVRMWQRKPKKTYAPNSQQFFYCCRRRRYRDIISLHNEEWDKKSWMNPKTIHTQINRICRWF